MGALPRNSMGKIEKFRVREEVSRNASLQTKEMQ
jgi:hypothetical protein